MTTLAEVQRLVLSRLLGSEAVLDAEKLKKLLPQFLLGAKNKGVSGLGDVLLDGWADGVSASSTVSRSDTRRAEAAAEEQVEVEFDLPTFAATVRAAARDCPTGRFGDNKVFISHVWRYLRAEPSFPALELPAFKARLVEANNARLLTLSRADLVEVMDAEDLRESETRYLNGEFHFFLLEKGPS